MRELKLHQVTPLMCQFRSIVTAQEVGIVLFRFAEFDTKFHLLVQCDT